MIEGLGPGFRPLVEYFVKTTAVLVPVLAAAAALKRRPAAYRHYLLSFALIGLLILPAASLIPVGWRTVLLPARTEAPVEEIPSEPREKPSIDPDGFGSGTMVWSSPIGGFVPVEKSAPAAVAAGPVEEKTAFVDKAVVFLWLGGLAALILRLAFGLAGAVRLSREGTALGGPDWRMLIERFLALVSLRRKVRLKSHPDVSVPLTWGWLKPVILMPVEADAWTETDRSAALFHELSHVKRADFLFTLLARLSLAAFWWNPLCWAVVSRIRREQEIACDELVLRAGIKPSAYAASLLGFRSSAGFRWNASAALLGLLGRSSFPERLAAILKQNMIFKEVKMKSRILLAAAVVTAVVFIGAARPAAGIKTEPGVAPAVESALAAAEETAIIQEQKVDVIVEKSDKSKIQIEIIGEGMKKKLLLDKPVTIKADKDGKTVIVDGKGTEYPVAEDEGVRLGFADEGLKIVHEGQMLKLDGEDVYTISEDDGKIITIRKSADGKGVDKIVKEIELDKDGGPAILRRMREDRPLLWVQEKERDLLAKVTALREKVEAVKAKKAAIEELEKSVKDLEEELKAKEEKIRELDVTVDKGKGLWTIREGDRPWRHISRLRNWKEAGADRLRVTCERKDGEVSLVFSGKKGAEGKTAFERVLDRLKKGLPAEGKILESKFDEADGTMMFKMSLPPGDDEDLLEKLVDAAAEELKK